MASIKNPEKHVVTYLKSLIDRIEARQISPLDISIQNQLEFVPEEGLIIKKEGGMFEVRLLFKMEV